LNQAQFDAEILAEDMVVLVGFEIDLPSRVDAMGVTEA
jgi:hypothetical protein